MSGSHTVFSIIFRYMCYGFLQETAHWNVSLKHKVHYVSIKKIINIVYKYVLFSNSNLFQIKIK